MKFIIFAVVVALFATAAAVDYSIGDIIDGSEARRGEAAYIVSLRLSETGHFCAGAIIAKNWIVTAGHCLWNVPLSFDVVAGLHEIDNLDQAQIRTITSRDDLRIHERYYIGAGPFDIGLIHISKAFNLNSLGRDGAPLVRKINLPSGKYSLPENGILYGWGRTADSLKSPTLQKMNTQIIDYVECRLRMKERAPIESVNICTHHEEETKGTCSGDSGGPLSAITPSGLELVGLVSWGYVPCATTYYPSVFTYTTPLMPWIQEKIDNFKKN